MTNIVSKNLFEFHPNFYKSDFDLQLPANSTFNKKVKIKMDYNPCYDHNVINGENIGNFGGDQTKWNIQNEDKCIAEQTMFVSHSCHFSEENISENNGTND